MNDFDFDFLEDGKYATSCYIAGIQYRQNWKETIARLKRDFPLLLEPEPTNKFDPNAVKILANFPSGEVVHLGYVPAKHGQAQDVADLLRDGTTLICKVLEADPERSPWHAVGISIEASKLGEGEEKKK